jgi:hypothetical protein
VVYTVTTGFLVAINNNEIKDKYLKELQLFGHETEHCLNKSFSSYNLRLPQGRAGIAWESLKI